MGKPTGFLEYTREENRIIPPGERLKTYKEFHASLSSREPAHEAQIRDARRRQGARCMDCGVPLCQSAMELAGMVSVVVYASALVNAVVSTVEVHLSKV